MPTRSPGTGVDLRQHAREIDRDYFAGGVSQEAVAMEAHPYFDPTERC